MRIRKKHWINDELNNSKLNVKDNKQYKSKWSEYFGNDNPIYIEIGCGKGRFTTENAIQNKDINFIAIEKDEQILGYAVRRARELEEKGFSLKNVAFITGDAKLLEEYFDIGEISRIYLNFSDPWRERKKWEKRRLTHRGFIEIYKKLLNGKGDIHFKTDNKALYEFSLNEFAHCNLKMKNITLDLHNSDFEGNIMTEYEEKFSSQGMPIYRVEGHIIK